MRSTNGAVRRYSVGLIPTEPSALAAFLADELKNIQFAIDNLADGFFEPIIVEPAKPKEGMVRLAEAGVLGATKDLYVYIGGVWKKAT